MTIDRYTRREFEARVCCIAILDSELSTASESTDNASINFTNYMVGGIRDIYFSVKACSDTDTIVSERGESPLASVCKPLGAALRRSVDTLPFLEIFRIMLLDEFETTSNRQIRLYHSPRYVKIRSHRTRH